MRKICFVITNRIHYARQKRFLEKLRDHPGVELQLIVGGSALLARYTDSVVSQIEAAGFTINEKLYTSIEGGNNVTMAKTAGLALLEFTNAFQRLNSDTVVIRGDRFEKLAAATAAAYLNKTVAHIEGGDVTGTIDESVRHAITKLSHIHFVTNEESRRRVLAMGEHPDYVFNIGSPDIEYAASLNFAPNFERLNRDGVGDPIELGKSYLMVMQHPVTTESEAENKANTIETLNAVAAVNLPTIWFWPNADAGTEAVANRIRHFREERKPVHMRFVKDLPPEEFIPLLKHSACLVGNSSAGIKEASFLGTPVVNIGTRQQGRLRAENVVDAGYGAADIERAIRRQIAHGPYEQSNVYYKPNTSARMVEILTSVTPPVQKQFYDNGGRLRGEAGAI